MRDGFAMKNKKIIVLSGILSQAESKNQGQLENLF